MKRGVPIPGPFHWSDCLIRILELLFGRALQLDRKLVGSTGKGRDAGVDLDSKAVILNGHDGGVLRVHFPLDSLLAVCAYPA